jgi:hypothetical protein
VPSSAPPEAEPPPTPAPPPGVPVSGVGKLPSSADWGRLHATALPQTMARSERARRRAAGEVEVEVEVEAGERMVGLSVEDHTRHGPIAIGP